MRVDRLLSTASASKHASLLSTQVVRRESIAIKAFWENFQRLGSRYHELQMLRQITWF